MHRLILDMPWSRNRRCQRLATKASRVQAPRLPRTHSRKHEDDDYKTPSSSQEDDKTDFHDGSRSGSENEVSSPASSQEAEGAKNAAQTDEDMQEDELSRESATKNLDQSARQNWMVLTRIKIPGNTYMSSILSEAAVRQVPSYSRKLDAALMVTPPLDLLEIRDKRVRREKSVNSLLVYLSTGMLEVLDSRKADKCLKALKRLLSLYDLAVSLEAKSLQLAMIQRIFSCKELPNVFVDFAAECYKRPHKILENCVFGEHIKEYLREHLVEFVEAGVTIDIAGRGGILASQLIQVFTECFSRRHHAVDALTNGEATK